MTTKESVVRLLLTLEERRKRVALGVKAGKSNRAIARELGCDEKLVRLDREFLAKPVEDRPVKKPKKVQPVRQLSPEEIHDRRLKELLAGADRWVAEERLQLEHIEYAVHEAGKLLYDARETLKHVPVRTGTPYQLLVMARPTETKEDYDVGVDFWTKWLARWLAACAPGDEKLQDEVLREMSKRARLAARPY